MRQKDPNRLWYWILVLLCLGGVLPVFFLGDVEPLLGGIPLWAVVSLLGSAVLTVATLIQLCFGWSTAMSEEDSDPDDE